MRSHSILLAALLMALLLESCTMKPRAGYDRNRGGYGNTRSTATGNASGSATAGSASTPAWQSGEPITGDPGWDAVLTPWLGTPYLYGGSSRAGTDCSGFVLNVYRDKTGVQLPRTSQAGFNGGTEVDSDELQIGDLVFFGGGWGSSVDHTGIYVGKNRFMHASTSKGVTVTPLDDPYWTDRYKGARRYPGTTP